MRRRLWTCFACIASALGLLILQPAHGAISFHLTEIGDLPGGTDFSQALAINTSGQVAGTSNAASGARRFFWDPTTGMTDVASGTFVPRLSDGG